LLAERPRRRRYDAQRCASDRLPERPYIEVPITTLLFKVFVNL
jgi:hypothetical protein